MVSKMCVAAANRIIEWTNNYNSSRGYEEQIVMTGKRLQKLLYFADVEYMKRYGESMFTDEFYAWPSGPVIPSVYYKFVQYQSGSMQPVGGEHTPLTKEMEDVIDDILVRSRIYDTVDLVEFSHAEGGPWEQIFVDTEEGYERIVPKDKIREFYKKREIFAT